MSHVGPFQNIFMGLYSSPCLYRGTLFNWRYICTYPTIIHNTTICVCLPLNYRYIINLEKIPTHAPEHHSAHMHNKTFPTITATCKNKSPYYYLLFCIFIINEICLVKLHPIKYSFVWTWNGNDLSMSNRQLFKRTHKTTTHAKIRG